VIASHRLRQVAEPELLAVVPPGGAVGNLLRHAHGFGRFARADERFGVGELVNTRRLEVRKRRAVGVYAALQERVGFFDMPLLSAKVRQAQKGRWQGELVGCFNGLRKLKPFAGQPFGRIVIAGGTAVLKQIVQRAPVFGAVGAVLLFGMLKRRSQKDSCIFAAPGGDFEVSERDELVRQQPARIRRRQGLSFAKPDNPFLNRQSFRGRTVQAKKAGELLHNAETFFLVERGLRESIIVQSLGICNAAVIAIKRRHGTAWLADKRQARPRRAIKPLDHHLRKIRRRRIERGAVQILGLAEIALLFANERQALQERGVEGTLVSRAILDRQGRSENAFGFHILRIPDQVIGKHVLDTEPDDLQSGSVAQGCSLGVDGLGAKIASQNGIDARSGVDALEKTGVGRPGGAYRGPPLFSRNGSIGG